MILVGVDEHVLDPPAGWSRLPHGRSPRTTTCPDPRGSSATSTDALAPRAVPPRPQQQRPRTRSAGGSPTPYRSGPFTHSSKQESTPSNRSTAPSRGQSQAGRNAAVIPGGILVRNARRVDGERKDGVRVPRPVETLQLPMPWHLQLVPTVVALRRIRRHLGPEPELPPTVEAQLRTGRPQPCPRRAHPGPRQEILEVRRHACSSFTTRTSRGASSSRSPEVKPFGGSTETAEPDQLWMNQNRSPAGLTADNAVTDAGRSVHTGSQLG